MSRPHSFIAVWVCLIGYLLLRSWWPTPALEPAHPFARNDIQAVTHRAGLLLGHRIDINHADAITLELLPGIGPATAQNILQYRTAHGPFRRVEDLIAVPGIGPGLMRRCAEWMTVSSTP